MMNPATNQAKKSAKAASLTTDDGVEFAWHTLFKLSDIAFKVTSWTILVGVVKAAQPFFPSIWFQAIYFFLLYLWEAFLVFSTIYLVVKDPTELGFLSVWRYAVKILMLFGALFMLALMTSPFLLLDDLISALTLNKSGLSHDPPHNAGH